MTGRSDAGQLQGQGQGQVGGERAKDAGDGIGQPPGGNASADPTQETGRAYQFFLKFFQSGGKTFKASRKVSFLVSNGP